MKNKFVRTTAINKILKLKKRIKAIQGGTSSGKTFGILPILIDRCIKNEMLEVSVVAESVPHLKRGAIRDFIKIMKLTNRWNSSQWNISNSIYTFTNGAFMEFFSADDDSKLRGARRDILYINEANNISFKAYTELAVRTKGDIYLDWNPTQSFWFHEEMADDEDVDFIITTYLDNEACPRSAIDYILNAKKKAETSKFWANWYQVYGLGQLGSLEGVVFENWEQGEFNPHNLQTSCGMDFGFSVDPDTLIEVAIDKSRKMIYLKEHIYQNGLKTDDLAKLIISKIGSMLVISEVDPRLVADLKYRGVNIQQHKKEKIEVGITFMQDFQIIIDPSSLNLIKEFRSYLYADKGSKLYKDSWNHAIDGARYNITHHLINPNEGVYYVY